MGGDSSIDKAESQLMWASLICLVFMIAEVIGGYMAGSLAIMTDAAHLLSDLAGFMVSLVCLWLTKRKATAVLSFGFKRAEVLGALLSVSLIWVVTGFLLVEAVERTSLILKRDPSYEPVNGKLMFAIACLGLLCNLIMLKVLGHSHSHGPGGSHGHSHAARETASTHGHSHEDHGHSHDDHGHSHDDHGHSHENGGDHGHAHSHDDDDCDEDVERQGQSHAHGGSEEDHSHHSHRGYGSDEEKRELLPSSSPTPPPLEDDYEMNGLSIRYSLVSNDYGTIESPTLAAQEERHKQNLNVEAAYIHALGDFIQSVGVIIAGGLIWMFPASTHPRMQLADPVATFLFSLLVLYSTFQVLKTSVNVLMEGVPAGLDPIRIKAAIERLPGVAECHDLHVWSLSIGHPFLSVHVVLEKGASSDDVLRSVHEMLYVRYRISHSTVQVEPEHHYSDGKLKKNTECHEYEGEEL